MVRGLYRASRNPMYVAVLCIVLGWALLFQCATHGWYAAGLAVAFHLRVVYGEEPTLARAHGAEWTAYAAAGGAVLLAAAAWWVFGDRGSQRRKRA